MTFWAYMLHCRGGYFYVGHTDDLERRVAQHQSGRLPGFSRDHLPTELVWSEQFPTRLEALAAERRIKGWGREKKLALIRSDWEKISRLAKKNGRASTSSARTGLEEGWPPPVGAELVEALSFHLDHPPNSVVGVRVCAKRAGDRFTLVYSVAGPTDRLRVERSAPTRTDGLWRHTCFEAIVMAADGRYREFNFAPSGAWAAYAFDGYRAGMRDAEAVPVIGWDGNTLTAEVEVDQPGDWRLNLSAVIEEADGTKSYWALAHPDGPPDFHDPACFVLTLPASPAA